MKNVRSNPNITFVTLRTIDGLPNHCVKCKQLIANGDPKYFVSSLNPFPYCKICAMLKRLEESK